MSDTIQGVFAKYKIEKNDGTPVDSEACYFVLRLDTDSAARDAMRRYAELCDLSLARDIVRCCDWLEDPPDCTCGGGRDSDVICPFHDGGMFGHPVWSHGAAEARDDE